MLSHREAGMPHSHEPFIQTNKPLQQGRRRSVLHSRRASARLDQNGDSDTHMNCNVGLTLKHEKPARTTTIDSCNVVENVHGKKQRAFVVSSALAASVGIGTSCRGRGLPSSWHCFDSPPPLASDFPSNSLKHNCAPKMTRVKQKTRFWKIGTTINTPQPLFFGSLPPS